MTIRLPAGIATRTRRFTASRRARVAAALSAALMLATLTGAARQPAVSNPVQAAFTPPGPYATTTGTVTDATGTVIYDLSTHGFWDSIIASPVTETSFFLSTSVHAALGIIRNSDGKLADHASIQDTADGGNPGGFLGYATAWLEYHLRGNATAAGAFTGAHPELVSNTNWPGSITK